MLRPPRIKRGFDKFLPPEIFDRYSRSILRGMARFYLQQGGDPSLKLGNDLKKAIELLEEKIAEKGNLPKAAPCDYIECGPSYNFPFPWAFISKMEIQYFWEIDVSFILKLKSRSVKKLLCELFSRMLTKLPIMDAEYTHEMIMGYDMEPEYDAGRAQAEKALKEFRKYVNYATLEPGWTQHVLKRRLPHMPTLTPAQRLWIIRCLRLLDAADEVREIFRTKFLQLEEYEEHAHVHEYFIMTWGEGFLTDEQYYNAERWAQEGWHPVIVIKTMTPEDIQSFAKVVSFIQSLQKAFHKGGYLWK